MLIHYSVLSRCLPRAAILLPVLLLVTSAVTVRASDDPYRVLQVPRSASISEIKSSYKELARKWHPDKSTDPNAEAKFIEINKAYDLLSDPDRREEFDRFGTTEDTPNFRSKYDYSGFKRFDFDPFESLFTGSGAGSFRFTADQGTVFRKQSITLKAYENSVIPDSFSRPYLILFYGDMCLPCLQAESIWQRIVSDMEPLGVQFATIHSQHESGLARKIGVSSLPYVIGVADGLVKHFRENQLNLVKSIEFIRRLLPRNLITSVDDSNYADFLSGWSDNRVRVIFVNNEKVIRLRYLLLAFKFRERSAAGHMCLSTDSPPSDAFTSRFGIDRKMDSMLIFNEYISRPIATLSAHELKSQIMNDVLESNKFLSLPRLSSQSLFDQLCPAESIRTRRKLCVVLVTNNIPEHDIHREAMRQFLKEHSFPKDRYRFMFILQEKQKEFISALATGLPADVPVLHVAVFWRREPDRLLFEWLRQEWDARDDVRLNSSRGELLTILKKLSQNVENFANDVRFPALIDEQAHGFIGKIVKKILVMTDGMTENISQKEILPIVSVALSLGFILLICYIMQYLVKMEEESIQERYRRLGRVPPGTSQPKPEPKLNVHELRGETYNGLVRLLKPGCRTIVLLCDKASKPKLLPKFYRFVYPYRKNKTLMFAYLLLEKNLDWYKKILQQTLGEHRDLNINPKNCIGTVIALNGFRKCFCVYHAKHPESNSNQRLLRRPREPVRNNPASAAGSFLGLDDSDSENEDVEAGNLIRRDLTPEEETLSSIVFEEHLLDGLPNWLDRLFDGTTHRYHIQYWPDHMK